MAPLDYLRYGIGAAQRCWLTDDDVIKHLAAGRLREFIQAKHLHRT